MTVEPPSFINSKYLVIDSRGWHLKAGAPKELQLEFEQFMKSIEEGGN